MIVESEGGGERRWGMLVSSRRLRGYGDEWSPIDYSQPYTEPANYVEQNPAQVPEGADYFEATTTVDPTNPAASTGMSSAEYNNILAAAQQSAKSTTDIIKALFNPNGGATCPPGYIYDPNSRQCYRVPGVGFDTNTLLMLGAGGLGLLAIWYLLK